MLARAKNGGRGSDATASGTDTQRAGKIDQEEGEVVSYAPEPSKRRMTVVTLGPIKLTSCEPVSGQQPPMMRRSYERCCKCRATTQRGDSRLPLKGAETLLYLNSWVAIRGQDSILLKEHTESKHSELNLKISLSL